MSDDERDTASEGPSPPGSSASEGSDEPEHTPESLHQHDQAPFPLLRLPPELISKVFETVVLAAKDEDQDDEEMPIYAAGFTDMPYKALQSTTLSQISHDLRALAFATPTLWVYLYEAMDHDTIDSFAARSGNCALQVRIAGDFDDESDEEDEDHGVNLETIKKLCALCARWGTIYINASVTKALMPYATTLPMLHALHMGNDHSTELGYLDSDVPRWEKGLKGWLFPVLTEYFGYAAIPSSAVFDISRLRKLWLVVYMPDLPDQIPASLDKLFAALAAPAPLEELSLTFDPCGNDFGPDDAEFKVLIHSLKDRKPITLPCLKYLEIIILEDGEPYAPVLDLLKAPHICSARFKLRDQHIHHVLQHSSLLTQSQRIGTLAIASVDEYYDDRQVISLIGIMVKMRALRNLDLKGIQLNMAGVDAPDGSKVPLNPECIPSSLHSITFREVEMQYSELGKFLDVLRQSAAWQHFEEFRINLGLVDKERTADFDRKVADCDGRVVIFDGENHDITRESCRICTNPLTD